MSSPLTAQKTLSPILANLPQNSSDTMNPKGSSISFKPEIPKQWRHVSIIALASLVATIGIERQTLPYSAASTTIATQAAVSISRPAVLLPSIKNIALPPLPVRKAGTKDPLIAANKVILIDEASQLPLYAKKSGTRAAIASTTKLATAIVAIENSPDLSKPIQISEATVSQIGSAVGFRVNETATISQLLHGLLIVSGNDAAYALAEQLGNGPEPTKAFIDKMNELAKRLKMDNTYFHDPAGLNDAGYSSAADMAKLMSYSLRHQLLTEIMQLAEYEYTAPEGFRHVLKNSNRLVTPELYYDGIIGGKTGFTPKTVDGGAGHCLVVAASRNGHRLVAVILDTHSQAPEASAQVARALFDYGFNNFEWQTLTR